jgi:hypothetical protein
MKVISDGVADEETFRNQFRQEFGSVPMGGLLGNMKLIANGSGQTIQAPLFRGPIPDHRACPIRGEDRSAPDVYQHHPFGMHRSFHFVRDPEAQSAVFRSLWPVVVLSISKKTQHVPDSASLCLLTLLES